MLLAHKVELRPTTEQRDYFEKACGHRRHCFNHILAWFSQRDSDGNLIFKWSKVAAYQFFMKVLRVEFPWYSEVSSVITRNIINDLDNAFKHFFRKANLRNCIVVIADGFFPSSQLELRFIPNPCSNCGEVKKNLTLERTHLWLRLLWI